MFGFETAGHALSTLFVAAGLSACPPPQKVDVNVRLVVQESPYITNVTAQWLTDNFQSDPDGTLATDGNWMVGGLTKSNLNLHESARFFTHVNTQTKATCLAISSVDYVLTYSPVIYIASDYKHLGCRYSQTLAHEKKHVSTDKRVFEKYIPEMKQEILKLVRKMPPQGPYPADQVDAQKQRILAEIAAVTKPYFDQLVATRRKEQAKIDTLENYKRETALCPGQFPKFDGSK